MFKHYFFYRNQFELEYQVFSDGIVGATFEYVCQLIIKNSLENIKRTQNALNSFSSTPNTSKHFIFFNSLKYFCGTDF